MAIVSRSAWGAQSPTSRSFLSSVNRVFIHYTGMDADEQADHGNCAGRVRGVQRFHMSSTPSDRTKPWSDIAYSFIVCKHGTIYEGRGFGVRTAATGSCNNDSLAICFLGNDSEGRDDVTDEGREAIVETVRLIEQRHGSVSEHGHRDCGSTACPGNELYKWLRAGLPLPPPPPPPEPPEDDLPYTPAELRDIMLEALETERGKVALQGAVQAIPVSDRVNGGHRELRTMVSFIHKNTAPQ